MIDTVEKRILDAVRKLRRGKIFFVEDLLFAGNGKAVNKALERLVARGALARVARGMYARPKRSRLLGNLTPAVEEIAAAIARRDTARIVPTGAFALHALGLSSQVPVKAVYLTDGAARSIQIGNRSILFKKSTPKNLAASGKISGLVLQALRAIGKGNVSPEERERILGLLRKEDPKRLHHDIALAPEWIRIIMREALSRR